jgi:hypothetical protein
MEDTYLKCVACGKNVLMLSGDKQEYGPIHLFCQMWGHPINQHDYNDPRIWNTKMYDNYLKKHSLKEVNTK